MPVGETVFISPGILDLDISGGAWIWMEGKEEEAGVRATRDSDGWSVEIPTDSKQKWPLGTKEKWRSQTYEPVKTIIWK